MCRRNPWEIWRTKYGHQDRENRKRHKKRLSGAEGKAALEKITVKELCALARINKSTFYTHYQDIYALSEKLEKEVVDSILQSIVKGQDYSVKNSDIFARNLYMACLANSSLINIVFSGKNKSRLADCLKKR